MPEEGNSLRSNIGDKNEKKRNHIICKNNEVAKTCKTKSAKRICGERH